MRTENILLIICLLNFTRCEDCCESLLITSSGLAQEYQLDRLGIYDITQKVINDRPVFKKRNGDDYLYYWKFKNNKGHNWLIR